MAKNLANNVAIWSHWLQTHVGEGGGGYDQDEWVPLIRILFVSKHVQRNSERHGQCDQIWRFIGLWAAF